MMGSERDENSRRQSSGVDGIIPQALTDVFDLVGHHQHHDALQRETNGTISTWQVSVSYLEVYNEQIRDLLQPSSRNCSLREDSGMIIILNGHWSAVHTS